MWLFITNFGDSSVMLPCAVLIALWLLAGLSARAALLWLLLFGAASLSVALSKIYAVCWHGDARRQAPAGKRHDFRR